MSTTAAPPLRRELRTDIQALRGLAVAVVVLYHAQVPGFGAGYLGVDVFFVVSGFLITGLIQKGIQQGRFRFADFYFRRAKRLLPAATLTFLATALLAPLFLTAAELAELRMQMLGALSFTANFVLWGQSGYFGGEAELKPLLHVWSLAIEEQYYFFLPATLVLVPRRAWMPLALVLLVASLGACLFLAGADAAFYLLPTRAWELGLGSVAALGGAAMQTRLAPLCRVAFWPALATLVVVPAVPLGSFHPGPAALLVCVATLVVLLREHPRAEIPPVRALARLGDLSYSLYLVHWPLFAFLNNCWMGEQGVSPPLATALGLVVLALLGAVLLHRYVEEPLRRREVTYRLRFVATLAGASTLVAALSWGLTVPGAGTRDYARLRRPNHGLGPECATKKGFAPSTTCRTSETPELLFWGDSYAMHLIPAELARRPGAPAVAQATRSVCGPLLGLAVDGDGSYDRRWARGCNAFNDAVLAWVRDTPSIQVVVLASTFEQYLKPESMLLDRDETGNERDVVPSAEIAAVGLARTVAAIHALGRRVVVVFPPPSAGFDSSRCHERAERTLPILGASEGCRVSREGYARSRARVLALLARAREQGLPVTNFDELLCDATSCMTRAGEVLLYRDRGHLSQEGAAWLWSERSFVEHLRSAAR